jgi:hypothetical protein
MVIRSVCRADEGSTYGVLAEGRGRVFRLTSVWRLDGEVSEAIAIFHDMATIVDWWPAAFMRIEIVDPGGPASLGKVVRLHTKGLLPHTFQFLARMGDVDRPDTVEIAVRGDFHGLALIAARKVDDRFELRFDWQIRLRHPLMSRIAPFVRPVLAWNHGWVMRHGRSGLQREIYRRRGMPALSLAPIRTSPTFPHNLRFVRSLYGWRRCPTAWID